MAVQHIGITVLSIIAFVVVSIDAVPWLAEERTDDHSHQRHQHFLNVTRVHSAEEKVIFLGAVS